MPLVNTFNLLHRQKQRRSTAWLCLSLFVALSLSPGRALAQNAATYDNWQSAPPGTFLKAAPAKSNAPAKGAPAKPTVRAKSVSSQNSQKVAKPANNNNNFAPIDNTQNFSQNQAYQDQYQSEPAQTGSSDWVTPDTLSGSTPNGGNNGFIARTTSAIISSRLIRA